MHYKYHTYSGTYTDLPKSQSNDLKEDIYEIDIDADTVEDLKNHDGITKEGYLMKGPDTGKIFFKIL